MSRQGKPTTPNRARFDLASGRHSAFMDVRKPLLMKETEMKMTTVTAVVIDTNKRLRGGMPVQVEFDAYGPVRVQHAGQIYRYTGKEGRSLDRDLATREMATIDDARLWTTLDALQIWED